MGNAKGRENKIHVLELKGTDFTLEIWITALADLQSPLDKA